ncbi:MAG: NTP transferase domain-containing protein [Gemmatimonadota bacterium]|nr:NTP transferase domain-containing protein [Gemmatimonadota bacterium]
MNTRVAATKTDGFEAGTRWLHLASAGEPVREALVLAAGLGSRLGGDAPKPLRRVLGLPLLARTLLTLERAGITDAWVVLGYRGDEIRREIEALRNFDIRIHWLRNEEWERPNGLSVLAAADVLERPFVLAMSDHVFSPDAVERLLENAHGVGGIALLADHDIAGVADVAEATKVRLDGDRIVEIGKSLDTFDAIDTGLFLATPELFDALRASVAEGRETLSDGVTRLAARGRARVVDSEGAMWEDVDTPADAERVERRLLDGLRKPQDGPVARWINRPISTRISRRLVDWPVTPNQISVGTLGIALVAAVLAAIGGYIPWLLGGFLFQAASMLDGVDGELAGLLFKGSRRGEWVDTICDNLSYLAFLVGLTVGVVRAGLPEWFLAGGIASVTAAFLGMASLNLYMLRTRRSGSARSVRYSYQEESSGPPSLRVRVLRFLHYFGKRDLFSLLLFLMAVAGVLPWALPIFGVAATLLFVPVTARTLLGTFRRAPRAHRAGAAAAARLEVVDAS